VADGTGKGKDRCRRIQPVERLYGKAIIQKALTIFLFLQRIMIKIIH